jgi:hypothetical protein
MTKTLGRRTPSDWKHVDRYPLTAATIPPPPTPIAIGVNWYSNFDTPEKVGRDYFIGRGDLGSVRGGHCVCVKPSGLSDYMTWYRFYDQGAEGACVGFGTSRMMTLLNRHRYDARWLWDQAKLIDEYDDTAPGDDNGTSVRAACEVLRTRGAVKWSTRYAVNESNWQARDREAPTAGEGIKTYRWATTVDQMLAVLSSPTIERKGAFPILNSWGVYYPHIVYLPFETMQRLLDEEGEAAVVVDL